MSLINKYMAAVPFFGAAVFYALMFVLIDPSAA